MDRQQPEHPVVVLAQVRLALLVGPVVGHRGDREERLLALVQRPGRRQHRAAERAQEDRRPADLERLVGEADEVALAAERLDPGVLLAAEVEQVVGRRVLGGDRVEDAADERRRRRRDGASTRAPGRPQLARRGGPSRPGPPRTRARPRPGSAPGVSVSERIVWRIFAANSVGAEPALAVARGQDDVAQVGLERGRAAARAVAAAAVRRGRTAATAGSSSAPRPRPAASASAMSSSIPASCLSAVSVWNRPTGRSAHRRRASPRAASSTAGSPSSRPAVDASRSASGANSRASRVNRPSPSEVDPVERVPGVLAQLGLREPRRLELADQQVAVDGVVGASGRPSPRTRPASGR